MKRKGGGEEARSVRAKCSVDRISALYVISVSESAASSCITSHTFDSQRQENCRTAPDTPGTPVTTRAHPTPLPRFQGMSCLWHCHQPWPRNEDSIAENEAEF